MLVAVPSVLDPSRLAEARRRIEAEAWEDGRGTAGQQSALAKSNRQLPPESDVARDVGAQILEALSGNALFLSAALPRRIFPPLFNRYDGAEGHSFGEHVDNAIRFLPDGSGRIRTDLSATLFLSQPDEYDGGELIIEDSFGTHEVKLPAGDMILYPASSLHRVEPVTRGTRFGILLLDRINGSRRWTANLAARHGCGRANPGGGSRRSPCGGHFTYRHIPQSVAALGE